VDRAPAALPGGGSIRAASAGARGSGGGVDSSSFGDCIGPKLPHGDRERLCGAQGAALSQHAQATRGRERLSRWRRRHETQCVGVQVDSGGLILKPSDRVLWTGRAIPARRGAGFHADRRPPPQVGVSGGISQQRAQATVRDFSRRRRQQLDFSRRRKRRNLCFSV
jgi:hypothetical protein